ncbi:T9SS type B sorting domain-containing protein [Pontibacter sp. H249]|uniref:T9SS type B sorting domain-containing protein n=1 Tax=Pontibacter sp. H249 TaxID=3133420 RepID=UPI0030BBFAB9
MALGYRLTVCCKWSFLILLITFLLQVPAQAQKENNVWYFGNGAGLDFNSGTPKVLTDGAFDAFEGTASVADASGKLLFYSDGASVWNRQHQIMANGTGLMGSPNSAQACIIIQNPGKSHIYYLFTTDAAGGSNGLRYSIIDITQAGGLGEVTVKNIPLYAPTSERLTATHHQNKRDVWVMSQHFGTSNFRSFLITEDGVGISTRVTNELDNKFFPVSLDPFSGMSCMKFSPNSKWLAATHRNTNTVRLFPFNSEDSGLNIYPLHGSPGAITLNALENPYGVEFSPDNSKLYVSTNSGTRIYQYDLTSSNEATINASKTIVGQANLDTQLNYIGASLQLAPDNKIYFARPASAHLGVINDPNASGSACNYLDKAIYLNGKTSALGLPAFVQSTFNFSYEVKYTINCFGQPSNFAFDAPATEQPDFMQWDFGDPASGADNNASTLSTSHNFSAPGKYTVTFTRHINNKIETYSITFEIKAPPIVNLGPERKVCPGTAVTLDATTPDAVYRWSNGSTSPTITTSTPGNYWVDVTVGNCTTRAETKISQLPLPTVNLGPGKELCQGDVLELSAFNQGATYRWQDGSTKSTFSVNQAGTYSVEVTSAEGCTVADEINIKYNDLPVVNLGSDRAICANTTITLDATQPGMSYKWQDGSTAPTFTVRSPGTYAVTLTNSKGCSATGSVHISYLPLPEINLGQDTTLCTNETLLLNATFPNSTYVWQDGTKGPTFTVKQSGRYWVEVTNEQGCTVRDEIWVPYLERPTIFLGNDTTLCFGDTLEIGKELPGDVKYKWQDGSTNAKYKVTKPGIYKLSAYNQHCEANDEIIVRFKDCIGGLFIPNIITPNGDGLNDVFFIHGLTEDNWDLRLFNRWGKEVYRTTNYRNDWAPPAAAGTGVYFYHLTHPATGRTYKGSLEVVF